MRPPFRADHVGSLLRPAALKKARAEKSPQLEKIEDDCIREAVRMQEAAGLQAVTDGEFRRAFWHVDFLTGFEGIVATQGQYALKFHGEDGAESETRSMMVVNGKVKRARPIMVEPFRFLKTNTSRVAKLCIPAPTYLHMRGGRKVVDPKAYPDIEEFWSDIAGGFEPLRFVPRGKKVVLGLISTKKRELEDKDSLKRRIDAASKYVPLENLCLSPQCGFASSEVGNRLSEDDQRRKLELVVEVAREVWG